MKQALLPLLLFGTLVINLTAAQIDRIEYFIDGDPGLGNGTPVTVSPTEQLDADFTIGLSDVEPGFHLLGIRTRDSRGQWSLTYNHPFYVVSAVSLEVPHLTVIEYYIDDDPGFGQGISVPVQAGAAIDETFIVDLTELANGSHTLYVRVRDSKGVWSLIHTSAFFATLPEVPPAVSPTIVTQPHSVTVNAGETVTLRVVATGTEPLSFQWSKDGNLISGATAFTLTFNEVEAIQAGTYAVVVSNAAGSVASAAAELIVLPIIPPSAPMVITPDESIGVDPVSGQFGFNVTGPDGTVVMIEGSEDLVNWTVLETITVGSFPHYFSDAQSATRTTRYYRLRRP